MKVRAFSACFVIGLFAAISCTVGVEDETLVDDSLGELGDEGSIGSIGESLRKGTAGAVNGATDYCNDPANLCVSGEGDCDTHAQCAAGTVCASNNGPKFGFGATFDVCAPAHCTNNMTDVDETGTDCGGSCGSCNACVGTPGATGFCTGCQCASGQGDCDANSECGTGLVCAANNGAKFGLPSNFDVCVPPHCTNRIFDPANGETGVDVGGPCQTQPGTPPAPARNVFFSEYVEGSGNARAVEIFNAGTAAQSCVVRVYTGGSATVSATVTVNTAIQPLNVFVLCQSGTGGIATPPCNQSTAFPFTGDDALELVCGGVTQDIVGQIGFDPGSQWGTGLASTADNTLRRKCSVTTGDVDGTDAFVPATQWDGFANNDFTNLGQRVCP